MSPVSGCVMKGMYSSTLALISSAAILRKADTEATSGRSTRASW